ncbi:TonB-dependent receptor [Lacinutrix sp. C3R15]|uniref:TonB-dependent receptor n=1 Tax=Flavobacteriaceae TaxID=49546 RepID=UPI001C08233F|nr:MULTISPECIES: TonB-dependent receptor [Flavobacteriaceae]MBU2939649.1 TonB-dependent receptor [Lacinutrix sp. C3R15]MDO6622964.1 TonB-dependent receptor [Oceanihabitans sp. 1_MG-2023]
MRKQKNKILVFFLTIVSTLGFSQERDQDTLSTEVIQVVKPYTPTVSDAFKVKEIPSLNDETTAAKKEIKYNIFSFPVASTFTPAKGKAAVIDKEEPAKLYDNYATLAAGMYTTILGEVYLNQAISRTESVGGYISHHSSQGGISDVLLDDNFSDTKVSANYARNERDLSWNIEGGFLHQKYNWYGLPQHLFNQEDADDIGDVDHTFYGFNLGGDITFTDSYIKDANVLFRRFSDNNSSGENRFLLQTNGDLTIQDLDFNIGLRVDYLGGKFERNYFTDETLNYGNFNVGLSPTYQLVQDDLTLDLGVSLFYLNDTEYGDSKFFIYPNIKASYRMVDEILIAYGGIQGDLIQNTYYDFTQENPFVSPTLFITPTDQKYNVFVGLKGMVSNGISYNIKGKYIAESDKAMFKNNLDASGDENYMNGNSFGLVYDDVSTFTVSGEINADINRNFTLGIKAEYFAYNVDDEAEAWNLPNLKANLFLDYQINKQWFAGANLFFVGERKDQEIVTTFPLLAYQTATLKSYFDANAHAGYHINDRLSVFAKANNIANQEYKRWQNYPVQGFQFLAGATYKFDF